MEKVTLPNDVLIEEVARLLSDGHSVILVPKGRSMFPFIREGLDKVVLVPPNDLQVGKIVLAHFGGKFVLHRIVAVDGNKLTLMGDGNISGTEEGVVNNVIGVVSEIITPDGRHHKPSRGRIWHWTSPMRKYLLKVFRKWHKVFG